MAKPKTKQGDPKSDFSRLNEDGEWDTMKAQVMAKIDMILKPATISYNDYSIQFSVPHYSPQLMLLDGSEKYTHMIKYALKAKSCLSAQIVIEPKVTEKQKVYIQSSFLPVI